MSDCSPKAGKKQLASLVCDPVLPVNSYARANHSLSAALVGLCPEGDEWTPPPNCRLTSGYSPT